jgi:hypothetical protein
MKKLYFVLTALLLAAPAFCAIDVNCTVDGNEVTVNYDASGESFLPRAFGLDITLSDGNIVKITYDDANFWVHPGTIVIVSGDVNDEGTPVAPVSDPCALGGIGTGGMTIEMGSLYDANDPCHPTAPPASGVLLKFTVDTLGIDVNIAGNAARGNVVLENTDEATVNYTGCSIPDECYTGPDYSEWVAVGKPDSWCYPKQCHGDATGSPELFGGRTNWVAVGLADMQVLLNGYNDPSTDYVHPDPRIAADFNHDEELFGGRTNWVHVGLADMQILLAYYNDPCGTVPADCLTSDPCVP